MLIEPHLHEVFYKAANTTNFGYLVFNEIGHKLFNPYLQHEANTTIFCIWFTLHLGYCSPNTTSQHWFLFLQSIKLCCIRSDMSILSNTIWKLNLNAYCLCFLITCRKNYQKVLRILSSLVEHNGSHTSWSRKYYQFPRPNLVLFGLQTPTSNALHE